MIGEVGEVEPVLTEDLCRGDRGRLYCRKAERKEAAGQARPLGILGPLGVRTTAT
jgi:hypothetical protein